MPFLQKEGKKARVITGTAMDQQLSWDLLSNCLKAANKLNINDDFTKQVKQALTQLEPAQIGQDGRILEWRKELRESALHHRHVSHLFALYPGNQYTEESTPALYRAAPKIS